MVVARRHDPSDESPLDAARRELRDETTLDGYDPA